MGCTLPSTTLKKKTYFPDCLKYRLKGYLISKMTIFIYLFALMLAFFQKPILGLTCSSMYTTRFKTNKLVNIHHSFQLNAFGRPLFGSTSTTSDLKILLRKLVRGTKNGVVTSSEKRQQVANIVKNLEKQNRIRKLTSSKLLDGSWRLLYTTNSGSSAGKIGPFVGEVEQAITLGKKKYLNYVRLPGIEAYLSATWDNLSDTRWRVKFETIVVSILGIKVQEKSLEGAVGTWRMTYQDEDLRILYAMGQSISKGPVVENVYILSK